MESLNNDNDKRKFDSLELNDDSILKLLKNDEIDDNLFQMKMIKGDLFDCEENVSIAHCISKDVEMGKGIAVEFKKRFGQVDNIKNQKKEIGQVAILNKNENSFIYYLITKERYYHKPSYSSLEKSLNDMKIHIEKNNIKELSMPKIGCGLDKLEWNIVKKMINRIFSNLELKITIYSL